MKRTDAHHLLDGAGNTTSVRTLIVLGSGKPYNRRRCNQLHCPAQRIGHACRRWAHSRDAGIAGEA